MGKSTLFNRLTKTRQAIVNEQAGTTRDRQYGKSEWVGHEFSVVDTGGWVVNSDDVFEEEIRKQVSLAIDEADVILFVVDVVNGVTDLDMAVASILRRTKKPKRTFGGDDRLALGAVQGVDVDGHGCILRRWVERSRSSLPARCRGENPGGEHEKSRPRAAPLFYPVRGLLAPKATKASPPVR